MQNNAQNARFLTFLTSKKIHLQPRKAPKGPLWVRFPQGVPKRLWRQSFFYTQRRIERLLTQPDSRTLGVLADTREYQNDCEDSRFFTPNGESNGC